MIVHANRARRRPGLLKVMASAVLLVALVTAVLPSPQWTRGFGLASASAASSGELNRKLEETQAELRQIRTKMAKAETARKAALGDIVALDRQIEELEKEVRIATAARDDAADELETLRLKLDRVSAAVDLKHRQLERTERDLETRQEAFNDRVANVYKSGGRQLYVAVLLEAPSLSRFVGRIDLLSAIVGQDNALLAQIKDLKFRVEEQKKTLDEERARLSYLGRTQSVLVEELKARAGRQQASLDGLESARKAKQQVVRKAERDKAAWAKQEDALLAESDRIGSMLRALATTARVRAGNGILAWPVDGGVSSGYGYRMHPIFHVRKMHTGIDISAGMGTPIRAASAGTVVSAEWRGGYGKCVVVAHDGGLATLYAHLSEILVKEGETIKRGEILGKVGSTGYSTGPHLHFEVRVSGSPVDPMRYL